jgi:riboflavin synthase
MFTGIIQNIGTVRSIEKAGDWRITIETAMDLSAIQMGASICCSGVCLTMVQKEANDFSVDVSRETLDRSGIGLWITGTKINLEPSLRLGDELGGHFVFGHVDAQAEIRDIKASGDSKIFTVVYKGGMVAPKGSVTLDGVSLTVNDVGADYFTVNVIPHTLSHTTLGTRKPGDKLNLEIDMLARYVANIMNNRQAA